eukprot:Opistho-2@1521
MELRQRNFAGAPSGTPQDEHVYILSGDGANASEELPTAVKNTPGAPRPLFDADDALFRGRGRILEALFRTPRNRRTFVALVFLVLGIATRFHRISDPHQVVFDEVHF